MGTNLSILKVELPVVTMDRISKYSDHFKQSQITDEGCTVKA